MDGQSINRSSNKFNIPARTLRDWMKRLNIKSVFTHHSQQSGQKEEEEEEGDGENGEAATDFEQQNKVIFSAET
jgi:hypothetical protein